MAIERHGRALIIVERGYSEMIEALRSRYGADSLIFLDRRQDERRRVSRRVSVERRSSRNRRTPMTVSEESVWGSEHHRVVYRPDRPA